MNLIYTWTPIHSDEFDCDGEEERYHGVDYCKQAVTDTINALNWGTQEYLGSQERIANEVFTVTSPEGMEASEDSEYDSSELNDLRDELFEYIDEKLNPYPKKLDAYVYENKGDNAWTADFACSQCGKFGVSINEEFLPIGRCCYCGWDNELEKCERCGQLVSVDDMENGFCPSCSSYIEKQ